MYQVRSCFEWVRKNIFVISEGGPVPPGYKVSKKGQLKPLNKDKKNKVGKKNKGSPHAMSPPMTGPGGVRVIAIFVVLKYDGFKIQIVSLQSD